MALSWTRLGGLLAMASLAGGCRTLARVSTGVSVLAVHAAGMCSPEVKDACLIDLRAPPRDPGASGTRCVEVAAAAGDRAGEREPVVRTCDGRVLAKDPETGVWME